METVHANQTENTSESHTGLRSREIRCHGCERPARSGCSCLTDSTIVRKMREACERLFVKGTDPAKSGHARADHRHTGRTRLQAIAAQAEQQRREFLAFKAFTGALPDNEAAVLVLMMEDAINGNAMPFHTPEWIASTRFGERMTIDEITALRNRCLIAMESWPVDYTEADAWAQDQARFEAIWNQNQAADDGADVREAA